MQIYLSQMCDPVKCWNFSGAWVDFSPAWGLVSLLLHHLLPWMPKAGGLRDLEVNSTSLSHNFKQIWLTWHASFQAWKQPVSHGQDGPGIQGNYISPNAPIINKTTHLTKSTPQYAEMLSLPDQLVNLLDEWGEAREEGEDHQKNCHQRFAHFSLAWL